MANSELAHWILEQKKKRFSDQQIKDYLLNYGYSGEVVDQAFNFVNSQGEKPMQMGQPPSAGGLRIGGDHYDLFAILSFLSIFFFPLLAIPLGIISLKHIKHDSHLKGKTLAILGIIFGILPLLLLILYIIFVVIIAKSAVV
ncbi:DUF4190 domain-containing protein [Candidatus Woesearchaeota archaeon]|jgi:hypothetical protein|nr:DUF4190 domain-containing protein [Candidatus Woesearchaeota archaeon]